MRKLSFVGSLLLVFISSFVSASPLFEFKLPIQEQTSVSFDRYDVYYGDFDGDFYQDLYFHGIISETSAGAIGEEQLPPPGFAYFGMFEGYQTASPWDMTGKSLDECRTCSKAEPNVDYSLGDMDGDGIPDILVKGRDASQSSLLISGVDDGGLPRILLEILPTGHLRVPGQDPSRESYFRNNLRDADVSIVDGQLVVDGVSHGLNQMRFAAGRNQSATTKSLAPQSLTALKGGSVSPLNISTPPTPSLPSHSLTAAQINDIDALSSLGGEFRVNEAGAATYTVPLSLPAGTAGVAPEITLFYSSQAGVGDMGLGWSMQAGGAITRCRQTLQQDGVALPIQFTESDRFCLNGQRLLVISGVYGSTGAQYKTEIDSGVHVTSVGGSNGHPDYFEVRDKDGSVSRYGGSGNHNSEQRGRNAAGALLTNRTFNWNLSEFKDSVGNKVVYAYQSAASYFRLSSVSYGYGSSTTPDVQVTFHYGVRKKSEIEWVMDSRFEENSLLSDIQIRDKAALIREYKIGYNLASAGALNDLADRVANIDSCLGSICAQPLKLSWGFPSPGSASKGNGKVTTYSNNLFSFGTTGYTVNGHPVERITEGDRDIFPWSVNNVSLINLAPGQFVHSYQETDINGDGRSDLLIMTANTANPKGYGLFVRVQTGAGFPQLLQIENVPGDPTIERGAQTPQLHPVDFNADGRMDLAVYLPAANEWRTYFSEPQTNGSWKLVRVDNFLPANMPNTLKFADVNSDALLDLIYIRDNKVYMHHLDRTGDDTDSRSYSYNGTHDFITEMPNLSTHYGWGFNIQGINDFNEDGRADLWISTLTSWLFPVVVYAPACSIDVEFTRLSSSNVGSFAQTTFPLPEPTFEFVNPSALCKDFVQSGQGMHERILGPATIDIDGDNLLDMVWAVRGYETQHTRLISYRRGLPNHQFGETQTLALNFDAYNFEFFDTDSDGDLDLLITGKDDARFIARWNGSGFDTPVLHLAGEAGRQTRYTDIDGDGNVDRLTLKDGKLTVARGRPRTNSVVIRFETGLDVFTNVAYEPLRDSARYQKLEGFQNVQTGTTPGGSRCPPVSGAPCTTYSPQPIYAVNSSEFYRQINNPFEGIDAEADLELYKGVPAQEFISTMPVVTRVVSSAPTAANADQLAGVDYSYEGLKVQAGGRGMLGFKKLTTTDMQTGVTTTTEYRQDWPFMGTPVRTTTSTHHGQLLSESTSRMRIHGITTDNIQEKRTLAKEGTAKLGPLVLYTDESRDITYSAPQELLAMPGGEESNITPTSRKLVEVVTATQVDSQGNTTRVQVDTLNGSGSVAQSQIITSAYYAGEGESLARLRFSLTMTSRPGVPDQVRIASFTYYGFPNAPADCAGEALTGLLCSEQLGSTNIENSLPPAATLHFYDNYGNKTHTRTGTRVSPYAQYDSKGRFVQATYDVFDSGGLTADSAPSGYSAPVSMVVIKTSEVLERDKFGNSLRARSRIGQNTWLEQVQSATPFGTVFFKGDGTGAFEQTHLQKTSTNANCPANTAFTKTVAQAGGAEATECYDKLGRAIGSYKLSLQGSIVRTQQDYDVLGRVIRAFEPAFGAPSLSTSTTYDVLNRPVLVTHPFFVTDINGVESSVLATTDYIYSGFNTETRHSGHAGSPERSRTEIANALGELSLVIEMGSRAVLYSYDALGNLTRTRNSAGNETVITYNGLGQKTGVQDPDKGTWSYSYNAYGELVSQTDANGTVTTFGYDSKGRKGSEMIVPASGPAVVHMWAYDRSANGLGQVGIESKMVAGEGWIFTKTMGFDIFGRASTLETEFSGVSSAMETHHQKITYDQFGRVFQTFDAARTGADFTRNGIENIYNERGYLTNVQDASSGESFYQIISADQRGNANVIIYGSGEATIHSYHPRTGFLTNIRRLGVLATNQHAYEAVWDHLGNMTSRKDSLMGNTIETFHYDQFNRLTRNTLGGTSVSVSYDIADNITSKSDVEGGATYQYHATKKHAVTKVGNREFVYDNNGNVTQEKRNGTAFKHFEYTANDLVSKITHNGHTSEFFYGPDDQRYKRVDTDSQGRRTTTLYIGSVEKTHYHDGVVEWKRQIGGIAQITHRVTNGTPNAGTRQYFHKDHLGSVTAITDGSGNVLQRMAFDPWGARRNINSSNVWQPTAMSHSGILASYAKTAKPYTSRGYTGHEMLDEVGIVHMNGRIYDANLARFLQADPFIQAPGLAASYNRYSYVMNNPMNAVDPSGYISLNPFKNHKKFGRKVIRSASKIFGAEVVNYVGSAVASYFGGAWGAALWSYEFSRAMGASSSAALKGAAISMVSSAAFSYIGAQNWSTPVKAVAHGFVGGTTSVLQGGKFGHGFVSAGVAKAFNVNKIYGTAQGLQHTMVRVAMASIVGGTVSEATGGKFANGARTAAMGQLFNGEREAARIDAAQKERQQKISGIRKTLYDTLERSKSYGKSEEGYILYETADGEILSSNKIVGRQGSLMNLTVDANTGDILWDKTLANYGVPSGATVLEILHTHPDSGARRFSGGLYGDVFIAEDLSANVSLSRKGDRYLYRPTGNVDLTRPRHIREVRGERL